MGERLMKLEGPVLAVRDLQASLVFYQTLLGLEIIRGFGDSVELEGGLSLQTLDSWAGSLGRAPQDIRFDGGDSELYFVTEDFDQFLRTLGDMPEAGLVHPPLEHRWGQRTARLYDPDGHILEIAESLSKVCKRFRDSGLDEAGIARRMDVPVEFVRRQLRRA